MLELIDFYADWCGPCKVMAPIFEELEKEYQGKVTFRRVDVEAEGDLAAKYGIMSIPTFVLTKEGKEVDRQIGAKPKEVIKNWINAKI